MERARFGMVGAVSLTAVLALGVQRRQQQCHPAGVRRLRVPARLGRDRHRRHQ